MKILFVPEEKYPCNEAAMEGIFTKDSTLFETFFLMRSPDKLQNTSQSWGAATVLMFPLNIRLKLLNTFSIYFFDYRYIVQLISAIKNHKPDVLIVRDMTFPLLLALLFKPWGKFIVGYQKSHPFEVRNATLQYSNNYRLPAVFRTLRKIDSILLHKLIRLADVVLPISTKMGEKLISEHSISPTKIHALTMGIDESSLNNDAASTDGSQCENHKEKYKLVYSGTLAEDRDIEKLIMGIKTLAPQFQKKIELIIVGGVDQRIDKLRELVVKENLSHQIFIVGYKTRKEVYQYYSAADFGLSWIPEKERFIDSSPTKMIEYAAFGLPLIATNGINEHEKMICKYSNGVLVDCNPSAVANGIESAIQNYTLLCQRSREIIDQILSEYSYQNIGRELYKYLKEKISA